MDKIIAQRGDFCLLTTQGYAEVMESPHYLPASLAGIAGLSLPCGATKPTSERPPLPIGLQLLAPAFAEERLLTVASAVERQTS